jgi:hypothetical protein
MLRITSSLNHPHPTSPPRTSHSQLFSLQNYIVYCPHYTLVIQQCIKEIGSAAPVAEPSPNYRLFPAAKLASPAAPAIAKRKGGKQSPHRKCNRRAKLQTSRLTPSSPAKHRRQTTLAWAPSRFLPNALKLPVTGPVRTVAVPSPRSLSHRETRATSNASTALNGVKPNHSPKNPPNP